MEQVRKKLFDRALFRSRVTTRTVSKKEMILGHLVGPLGLIFIVNTIAALVEKFFLQQVGAMYADNEAMVSQMGHAYGIAMTVIKFVGVGMGLLISLLIAKTKSTNGRFRPLYLIFSIFSVLCGFLIFLFNGNIMGEGYWFYFFLLLATYNTFGSAYFFIFRDNIVSVSTRSPSEKFRLSTIRKVSWTLISGIIIGMVINTVLLPMWLDKDVTGYPILMVILTVVSIPLVLMEFYYTRERVIEDGEKIVGEENVNKVPLKEQFKALFTNKYFVIITVIMTVSGIVDNFKGGNVQYLYVKYCLGGVDNDFMQLIYTIATGVPLGLGAIIAYPLGKKFGIKNVTLVGYGLVLAGSVIGWIFPNNVYVAIAAGFIRQMGYIPNAYVFITLLYYAYDSIEFKSGHRLEGLVGIGIVTAAQSLIYAPFAGGYESGILQRGFVDVEGAVPNQGVISWINLSFYLFDIILAATVLVLLPFVDVEKHLPEINAELYRRKQAAVLAKGEEWIDPEVKKKLKEDSLEEENEANRILDLKDYCEKKGLDFETENAKILAKREEKEKKRKEKEERKANKKKK
ncbi:MAG: MFS transporter [Bacilli bacterium]|nr:MFS transporter [Bacilli bacterium]